MLFEIILFFSSLVNATTSEFTGQSFQLNAAIIGSSFGAIVAIALLIIYEIEKEKKDIRKVRKLVAADFLRLYALATELYPEQIKEFKLELDKKLDDLISKKLELSTFLLKLGYNFEFNFWRTINSSGYLIKLPDYDIHRIQVMVDLIQETQNDSKKMKKTRTEKIELHLGRVGGSEKNMRNGIKTELTEWIKFETDSCEAVEVLLREDTKLSWFNLTKLLQENRLRN